MKCVVPLCMNLQSNSKRSGLKFYKFPKDPNLRAAWIKSLGVEDVKVNSHSKICAEHFTGESFYETKDGQKIHPDSLPNIILDPNESASLKICRICLAHHRKMHNIREFSEVFQQITSIPACTGESSRLPQRLCWECAARLTAAASFRAKALLSDGLLQDLLKPDTYIRIRDVKKINTKHFGFKSSLLQQHFDSNHFDYHINDTYADLDNDINDSAGSDRDSDINGGSNNENNNTLPGSNKDNDLLKSLLLKNHGNNQSQKDINNLELNNMTKVHINGILNNAAKEKVTDPKKTIQLNEHVSLYIEHNYSNPITDGNKVQNSNENNNEVSKNQKVLSENCPNSTNIENKVVSEPTKEGEINQNIRAGNWNIEVEKSSKTLTIIPLNVDKEKGTPLESKMSAKPMSISPQPDPKFCFRRRKEVDPEFFEITMLTYEGQVAEIEMRQESDCYIEAPFKCNICFTGFKVEEVFERHMLRHTEKAGPFECFICKIRMRKKHKMNQHLCAVHSREYKCRKCIFVTRNRLTALKHIDYHAGLTRFKCELCNVVFDKESSYLGHRRLIHLSDLVCELCGHTFLSKMGVNSHKIRQHLLDVDKQLEGPYCEKCDVKFFSQEAHDRHLRCSSKHLEGEDDPKRIRNQSGTKYDRPSRPVRRMQGRVKRTYRRYVCEQCGKTMSNYSAYKVHFVRAHPGQRRAQRRPLSTPWMCDHCGKMFKTKLCLESHLWVHTGEKLYECEHCKKKFSQKVSLRWHILGQHGGDSSGTKCHICDKVFSLPANLRLHLTIHKGEKPFKCEVCQSCFSNKDRLKTHTRHVHDKIPWPSKRRKIYKQEDVEREE